MGKLTTHILDTANGSPASGVKIELFRLMDGLSEKLCEVVTNADGRCDAPILEGDAFVSGKYELVFHAGTYLDGLGMALPDPKFLDEIVIRFGISSEDEHYHVPLLLSPYSYGTYRGS